MSKKCILKFPWVYKLDTVYNCRGVDNMKGKSVHIAVHDRYFLEKVGHDLDILDQTVHLKQLN